MDMSNIGADELDNRMKEDNDSKSDELEKDVSEIRKQICKMKEDLREKSQDLFKSKARQIFSNYPLVESFGWTQYTPYFNDGDPCYFRVSRDSESIYINGKSWYDYDEEEEEVSVSIDSASEEIAKFLMLFDKDDLESIFGDHARITVTPDNITIDEYSHD